MTQNTILYELCLMDTKQCRGFFPSGRKEWESITDPLLSLQHQLPQWGSFPRNQFPVSPSHRQSSHHYIPTCHPTQFYPTGKMCWEETHTWWVSLQGSQVVLQGDATAIIQHGFHTSQVSLHQLLLLTRCFFLQRFHHGLEVLEQRK